jgi:Strictosidine synthase
VNMFDIPELIRVHVLGERDAPGIPALDGPWKQNELIGDCAMVDRSLEHPDDVVVDEFGKPWVSAGNRIYRIGGSWFSPVKSIVHTVEGRAGAMCQHPDGSLIVAISGSGILVIGPDGSRNVVVETDTGPMKCVTALAMSHDGDVLITDGSRDVGPERWVEDFMRSGSTGRLLRLDWKTGKVTTLFEKLAWPFGVCPIDQTTVLVSESWKHRLLALSLPTAGRSSMRIVLENLPGYPSRIVAIQGGGYWLALFALRNPLIEFVLGEKDFLREMLETVPPRYWIAPAMATRDDHREPLQLGSIKQVGMKKPFSPPYSYGLVAKLNERLHPVKSMHSRADGKRHGITGLACPNAGSLYILSAGNGKLVHAGDEVLSK